MTTRRCWIMSNTGIRPHWCERLRRRHRSVRKWLWLRLNSLRVWMVTQRLPARSINRVSSVCVRLLREGEEV